MKKLLILAAALLGLSCGAALAQTQEPTELPGCVYNVTPPTLTDGQKSLFQCTSAGAINISGTINATSAATATAAAPSYVEGTSDPFSQNLTGDLRVIAKQSGTWTIGAGSAVIGHVIADTGSTTAVTQATGTNLHAVIDTGSTTAVTQATATNLNAAVVGTGTAGSPAGNILTVQGVTSMTPLLTASVAGTTGGCTPAHTLSAASTNATSVKGSAGTLCGLTLINTTATLYYFKLYDKATAPTCNSDTVLYTVPVPSSTAGAGAIIQFGYAGLAFTTGIGFCLTGALADNDNTNAATGVALNYSYK